MVSAVTEVKSCVSRPGGLSARRSESQGDSDKLLGEYHKKKRFYSGHVWSGRTVAEKDCGKITLRNSNSPKNILCGGGRGCWVIEKLSSCKVQGLDWESSWDAKGSGHCRFSCLIHVFNIVGRDLWILNCACGVADQKRWCVLNIRVSHCLFFPEEFQMRRVSVLGTWEKHSCFLQMMLFCWLRQSQPP